MEVTQLILKKCLSDLDLDSKHIQILCLYDLAHTLEQKNKGLNGRF